MTPEQLQKRQEEIRARNAPPPRGPRIQRGHNRRSATERLLRGVMLDPNASADAKVKAALAVERMRTRRLAAKKAAMPEPEPEPESTLKQLSPEDVEELVAEINRRTKADEEVQAAFRAKRRAYFDAHPDRAGEVLAAIGAAEFTRITQ